ncbi:MAG: 3-dehydroquinate synthase [Candidatus Cloacimonetes bacterium]|nr:3-dehydroquinate synthase [Candidatus Cloacimonadota bacterium]
MYDFKVKSIIHDYEVSFIDDFSESLNEQLEYGDVLIIDKNVLDLYKKDLIKAIKNYEHIIINATEEQKSYTGLVQIIHKLIDIGFKRNNHLIAIGGGITQDVTAFTASILFRGVQWLFYPTTLLAQGDSCIGSKTSINFGTYKNQLGGFYPPKHIFIDLKFLDTLTDLDLKSGFGEMSHYFVIAGEKDFERYKKEYPLALTDKKVLSGLIARSLEIKKRYIEIDEFDKNERQVFNYGHSFGHAIESLTNYRIPHGIAVSYGMDMANYVSMKLGYISENIRNDIRELLAQIWHGTSISDIHLEKFKIALSKDKKNVGEELRLILNKGYGKIFKDAMKMDDHFSELLKSYFSNELQNESK